MRYEQKEHVFQLHTRTMAKQRLCVTRLCAWDHDGNARQCTIVVRNRVSMMVVLCCVVFKRFEVQQMFNRGSAGASLNPKSNAFDSLSCLLLRCCCCCCCCSLFSPLFISFIFISSSSSSSASLDQSSASSASSASLSPLGAVTNAAMNATRSQCFSESSFPTHSIAHIFI